MARSVPRLQFWGGDHRSNAFYGLAKLLMHDEYQRIEAIRRSRRERAKRAHVEGVSAEANDSGNDAANKPAVDGPGPEDNDRADDAQNPPEDGAPRGPEVVPEGEGGAEDPEQADHQNEKVSSHHEPEGTGEHHDGSHDAVDSQPEQAQAQKAEQKLRSLRTMKPTKPEDVIQRLHLRALP